MKWILFSAVLGFLQPSFAIVDMKNANFSSTWIDLEVPGNGYDLKISRTYNSRSLFNGIFGFGWCSDFETKISITQEDSIKLTECGGGLEVIYSPSASGASGTDSVVQAIITKMKSSAPGQPQKYFDGIAQQMRKNPAMREKLAKEYNISSSIKEGRSYFANGVEVEKFVLNKGIYTRYLPDGSVQKFDSVGRLIGMMDKNGNSLKLNYDQTLLKEVIDNNARKLSFSYNTNKKLTKINGPFGTTAEYKFANLEDLSVVKNAWGNNYTYEYDDLHNLTKATWPDKTSIQLTYDQNHDWTTSFKDRQNCLESYVYAEDPSDAKNHYWSNVKKVCGKDVVNESKFEFFHKKRSDGASYLQRTVSSVNGNVVDVVYHETFGKPLTIKRNAEKINFEYYENGLVKTKSTNFSKLAYEYDSKTSKVSKAKTTFLDDKGKKISEKVSEFKYDEKGNLVYALNTDGQKINLTYDSKGRIATIVDQAKKLVKIKYDEKFSKPALVSRPGLGTIKISYKSSGEIEKADSPDGPQVAVQVASTFNNLLDIIAPASNEIFN